MKLWAGRFQKETDSRVNDFNSSIGVDCRMFREDIEGSIAHATMLGEQGILKKEEAVAIVGGLAGIRDDLESGRLAFDPAAEDIHMFVESELTARLGNAGKRLHTARSRNDQVATDFKLCLRHETEALLPLVFALMETLCRKAERHLHTVMPGYTHLQRAQPITLGHHLMAYAAMLMRDVTRLEDWKCRMNECPLGCGALATSTYPVNRARTAELLGFDAPTLNSLDGVSDRDFAIELLSVLSLLMMHLSRFSEEIILWSSWEFKFVELDDAFATGSSIMPQKKNPDVAELIRGKAGRVFGSLTALLSMMKGLPLAYNKDMQEDKEAVFDALDTVRLCLITFTPMLETMKPLEENMRRAADGGFINATDCADYLVGKGLPFRDAYKITGGLVARCIAEGKTLLQLTPEEFREACPLFDGGVYAALDPVHCATRRSVAGGPAPEAVRAQIDAVRAFLAARKPEK